MMPASLFMRGQHKPMLRAWSQLATMRLDEGLASIGAIEARCEAAGTASSDLQCAILQAAALALRDDAETAAQRVEAMLRTHDGSAIHPAAWLLLRLGHWKARRLDAFFEFSGFVSPAPANRREALWSIMHLSLEAAVEAEQLRLASAERLADEALSLSRRFHGPNARVGRLAAILSAKLLYEKNLTDKADDLIRDRLALCGSQAGVEGALIAYTISARIAAARGQMPFAMLLLHQAEQLAEERGWPRLMAASLADRIRLLIEDDRGNEAAACLDRLAKLPGKSGQRAHDFHLARHVIASRARLALSQGGIAQTVPPLRQAVSQAWQRRECHLAIELAMLLACCLRRAAGEDEAVAEATRAIRWGATAGVYRSFIDGGDATGNLLAWLYERQVEGKSVLGELRPYVRNLLLGFSQRPARSVATRNKHRSGESLSPRERHVVWLMSHGMSNKSIARQLGIAPETVKSHAKHILLKLAAQTRVEAVSRAFSLGLI
jgi:ATP/maltotriose-dependent transcriptional regulator MalT